MKEGERGNKSLPRAERYAHKMGGGLRAFLIVAVSVLLIVCAGCAVYLTFYIRDYFSIERRIERRENEEGERSNKGEKVVFYDGSLGEVAIPAIPGILKNEYDLGAFSNNNGIITYDKDGEVSFTGIDVSSHQGDIDWEKVKESGVHFAMIRLGFRGYAYGNIKIDDYFQKNIKEATAAGIHVGVYFFSQAINEAEAREEAAFVLSELEGYDVTYPVVFDWEVIAGADARTDEVSVETLTACAVAFCEEIEKKGYIPMIYANKRTALFKYDLSGLKNYDLWIADYNYIPAFYYDFEMWQYSEKGTIDGIETYVDLNLSFFDYASE